MVIKNACKDCPDRAVGCHSKCEKYIEFKNQMSEVKKKEEEYKISASIYHQYGKPGFGNGIRQARKSVINRT